MGGVAQLKVPLLKKLAGVPQQSFFQVATIATKPQKRCLPASLQPPPTGFRVVVTVIIQHGVVWCDT